MAIWTRNTDGEYGSHVATCNGHKLEVYCDRLEQDWSYSIDDELCESGMETKEDAMEAAERDARDMGTIYLRRR